MADNHSPVSVSVIIVCAGNKGKLLLGRSALDDILVKFSLVDDLYVVDPVVVNGSVELDELNIIPGLSSLELRKERRILHVMP